VTQESVWARTLHLLIHVLGFLCQSADQQCGILGGL
jgi:hypothetical protein